METAAAGKKPVLRSKYKTRSLTEEADSENNTLEQLPRKGEDRQAVVNEDPKSEELSGSEKESPPQKKRSFGLRIALQFPSKKCESKEKNTTKLKHDRKKMPAKRKNPTAGEKVNSDCAGENDQPDLENANALLKRAMNIKENKAVLAQLLAELHSVPDLFPMKSTSSSPSKQKKTSRRTFSEGPVERRTNPTRTARPPENFALETFTASAMQFAEHLQKYRKKTFQRRPLTEEEKEEIRKRRRSSKCNYRSVEDITEEELENVADTVKDKVYDKIVGSTCHQCRQKTVDTKTFCRNPGCGRVKGQFCGPCLRNRYGEDVREALLDPDWICPPCREICNCSFCRKRDGRCATGMLIHLAKFSGHDNVKEYLESLQKQMAEDE